MSDEWKGQDRRDYSSLENILESRFAPVHIKLDNLSEKVSAISTCVAVNKSDIGYQKQRIDKHKEDFLKITGDISEVQNKVTKAVWGNGNIEESMQYNLREINRVLKSSKSGKQRIFEIVSRILSPVCASVLTIWVFIWLNMK